MEIMTILRRITEVMSTNPVNLVLTIVSHTLLLIGLVYTVIHLIKMMFEPDERDIIFEEVMIELKRKIS